MAVALSGMVLAVGLLGGAAAAPGVVLGGAPSSDIPGVPLPGPVATGPLGGPVYDVVYQVTIPAGNVLLASLTGTSGTDFDLYLFDSTATTVVSNVGLVTQSIGPTSTESISYGSRGGGMYYIDLNGSTDVLGSYTLAVQIIPDTTPPSVSMVLAGGSPTNQLEVPVALRATDDLSTVDEMAFSPDGSSYGPWEPFRESSTWSFSPGGDVRTLWVRVRNALGLESAPVAATVIIDQIRPSAIDIEPAPGSVVSGLRPRFTVRFDEPIAPDTWQQLGLIVQDGSGQLVPGVYEYDPAGLLGTFVPARDLIPGALYIVTVGSVTDVAGNLVAPRGSWTVTPAIPTSIALAASPGVIPVGAAARLDAVVDAPGWTTLDVAARGASDPAFVPLTTVAVVDGRASLVVRPAANTTYRLANSASPGVAPAAAEVRILVRRSVVLVGPRAGTVTGARVGRSVRLVAAVDPAAPGVSVSFRLYRYDASRRAWIYAGSRGRATDPAGRASYTWTPTSSGSFYWRVAVASTPDHANNVSPVYRFSVRR